MGKCRMSRKQKELMVVAAATLILSVLLVAGCGTSIPGNTKQGASTNQVGPVVERDSSIGTNPDPNITAFTDLSSASKAAGFAVAGPKQSLGGNVTGITIGNNPDSTKWAHIEYSSGFFIAEIQKATQPDYQAEINTDKIIPPGTVERDQLDFHTVSIAGHPGKAHGPGYAPISQKHDYEPAQVVWWNNGIEYTMDARDPKLTEAQLIQVAESFYK